MKFFCIFLFVTISFQVHSQVITSRDSLVGTWISKEVKQLAPDKQFDTPEGKPILDTMKKAYLGSTFTFGADGIFRHTVTKTTQDLSEMLKFLNGQKWDYKPLGKTITIGEPKENLMLIDVVESEGQIYFVIKDMPLWLRMERK